VQCGIGRHEFDYGYSCIGSDARSNEKLCLPMRAAPDGFHVSVKPALAARSYLNCLTKKVIVVDAPTGSSSSSTEENVGFWIEETAIIITLADGTPLIVRRFNDRWISATRGDVPYEIDRQNEILSYASSTTKSGTATIIIGSGRCKVAASPAG